MRGRAAGPTGLRDTFAGLSAPWLLTSLWARRLVRCPEIWMSPLLLLEVLTMGGWWWWAGVVPVVLVGVSLGIGLLPAATEALGRHAPSRPITSRAIVAWVLGLLVFAALVAASAWTAVDVVVSGSEDVLGPWLVRALLLSSCAALVLALDALLVRVPRSRPALLGMFFLACPTGLLLLVDHLQAGGSWADGWRALGSQGALVIESLTEPRDGDALATLLLVAAAGALAALLALVAAPDPRDALSSLELSFETPDLDSRWNPDPPFVECPDLWALRRPERGGA